MTGGREGELAGADGAGQLAMPQEGRATGQTYLLRRVHRLSAMRTILSNFSLVGFPGCDYGSFSVKRATPWRVGVVNTRKHDDDFDD